jgi:uncharacterized protein (TIGR02145 family)
LYNWYVVGTGKLAPPPQAGTPAATNWHVPTKEDWDVLMYYLIDNGYNYDGTTTGNKLAKSMATGKWEYYSTPGTVGNNLSTNNRCNFSALPGGHRFSGSGQFISQSSIGYWWSSTEYGAEAAKARVLYNSLDYLVEGGGWIKQHGFSVRLVRNIR